MSDHGERVTEAEYQRLRAKIVSVYGEAYHDIVKKSEKWAEAHEKRVLKYQQAVREGRMTEADYRAWMRGQFFQSVQWKDRKRQIENVLHHADTTAQAMVNGSRHNVFAENGNVMGYGLEQHGRIDAGFMLYDANSVARLIRDDPDLLPPKQIGKDKAYEWYNRQIDRAVTQGIIQGETLREIGKRIGRQTGETNCAAMLRNARTAYTGAQNAGRLEGMRQAQKLGINVRKMWVAILDRRTRDSHAELDGQTQELEDPFESPLGHIMFPGDPGADDPSDVWNCRCSMIYDYPEYPSDMVRRDGEGEVVEDMTYNEWKAAKEAEGATKGAETIVTPRRIERASVPVVDRAKGERLRYVGKDGWEVVRETEDGLDVLRSGAFGTETD